MEVVAHRVRRSDPQVVREDGVQCTTHRVRFPTAAGPHPNRLAPSMDAGVGAP